MENICRSCGRTLQLRCYFLCFRRSKTGIYKISQKFKKTVDKSAGMVYYMFRRRERSNAVIASGA